LARIDVPEVWKNLVPNIRERKGVVMVIGAPDTGKTTLTGFLVRQLALEGEAVAYIDGDMGQSVLALPTTQGMAVFDNSSADLEKARLAGAYFVGSTSPRGHGLETVVGLKRLLEKSQADRNRIAVLDTTGYVTGQEALELKYQKIDLLHPSHIVAVQHQGEIEHIIRTQQGREGVMIHRVLSPPGVQKRSQEERRRYRWSRFKAYFDTLRLHRVDLKRTSLTGAHRLRIHERPQKDLEGLLLGLNDPDNFLVAIGILETIDPARENLSCLVPANVCLDRARAVRLGTMRIDLSEDMNGEQFFGSD
jgi:polynucleotide 5'-hydroxyl-kinase GRC3/NOL9